MTEIDLRIQKIVGELRGNEALLDMLDTAAADEMLNWGIATITVLVQKTADLDGPAADLALAPRLKAVRQSMRSMGNWVAGKYTDAAMRIQLREKLLEQFRLILGETAQLPSAGQLDELLNQIDDPNNTPDQLIVKCRQMFEGFK